MNRISDARIRELYQLAVLRSEGAGEENGNDHGNEHRTRLGSAITSPPPRSAGGSGSTCPSPQDLLSVAEASGSEESRLYVIDHAMACPTCRADFVLLVNIRLAGSQITSDEGERAQSEQPSSAEDPLYNSAPNSYANPKGAYRRWSVWGGIVAVSAALFLAVNIAKDKEESVNTEIYAVRGGASQLRLIAPAQSQRFSWSGTPDEGVITFSWNRLESVADYHFEVVTPEGETVVSATTSDTTLTLAAAQIREAYNSINDADLMAHDEKDAVSEGLRWWVGGRGSDGVYERSEMRRINFR